MSNHERRNSLALDDALDYCRHLESQAMEPELFKLISAIATLDLALSGQEDSPMPMSLCTDAWSRVRDSLFNMLISSFPGRVEIYDDSGSAVDPGYAWPESGTIRFFPSKIRRRSDGYEANIARLSPEVTTALRWCMANERMQIKPADFEAHEAVAQEPDDEPANGLIERFFEVCEEEARQGKKRAHRKWWQLYWESSSCPNKRQKHQLRKQMVALEGVWGKPAQ